MKKILLSLSLFFAFSAFSLAQSNDLHKCGTPHFQTKWMKAYYDGPRASFAPAGDTLYVPITVHILGRNDGTGYFSLGAIYEALCTMNQDYAPAEVVFFFKGDVNYIDDTDYYNHSSVLEGAEMMFTHNIGSTINTYFVNDPAGNCGYNLPYAGIAMAKSCSGPADHTWTHEVGHNLTLQHTFLGWEGGVSYDGSITHDYSDPAPETVLYDYTYFKDTLIIDTLIIDTALVEKMDGSNCYQAADKFCDTEPDYLAYRWNCDANGESTVTQTDPDTVSFKSNANNFMSYSNDVCVTQFTPEQITALRDNLIQEKADYLTNPKPNTAPITEEVTLLSPMDNETVSNENIELVWNSVENATGYILQVSFIPNFSTITFETYVSDTSYFIGSFSNNLVHRWRVKPVHETNGCAPYSPIYEITLTPPVSVNTIENIHFFKLFPNPSKENENFSIQLSAKQFQTASYQITDVRGKVLVKEAWRLNAGENYKTVNTQNWTKGIYFVHLQTEEGQIVEKMVLQ